jgi:hypothetical protein
MGPNASAIPLPHQVKSLEQGTLGEHGLSGSEMHDAWST